MENKRVQLLERVDLVLKFSLAILVWVVISFLALLMGRTKFLHEPIRIEPVTPASAVMELPPSAATGRDGLVDLIKEGVPVVAETAGGLKTAKKLVDDFLGGIAKEFGAQAVEGFLGLFADEATNDSPRAVRLPRYWVRFDPGSSKLPSSAEPVVSSFCREAEKRHVTGLVVEGHTDLIGKPDDNFDLSYRRASAVATLVRNKCRNQPQLKIHAWGESRPQVAAPTSEPENRIVTLQWEKG